MSTREFDVVSGQASFKKLKDALLAIPTEKLVNVNANVDDAATAALNLVDYMRKEDRMALLGKLPVDIIEKNLDVKLEDMAHAAQFIALEATKEEVATSNVKVAVAIIDEATEVRKRMLKAIKYSLDDKETVMREVADIELGSGYKDLANDLVRTIALYGTHKKAIAQDKKNYRASDVEDAQKLVVAIRSEFRASGSKDSPFADLKRRVFTEVSRLYKELRAAGRFVYRNREDILDELQPLRVAMGIIGARGTGGGGGTGGTGGGGTEGGSGGGSGGKSGDGKPAGGGGGNPGEQKDPED